MKNFLFYCFVLFGLCPVATAQTQTVPVKLEFQDSVQAQLVNTRAADAIKIGERFAADWKNSSPDVQQTIKTQVFAMKKKGCQMQPHYINYFGALVAALDVAKMDGTKLTSFLSVMSKAIQANVSNQVNVVLNQTRNFLEHHLLNKEKIYKLRAVNDEYVFDYLEAPPPDTTQVVYDPKADSITATLADWQRPKPQPTLQGPVIIFKKVSLYFSSIYDSAGLKNTAGTFSLRDQIFVGEGGRFDWSSTGLSGDSVYYDFQKFNFKTSQPILVAGQGEFTYLGKVAGSVPGAFQFRIDNHAHEKQKSIYPQFKSYENKVALLGFGKVNYTGGCGMVGQQLTSSSVTGRPSVLKVADGKSTKKFKATSQIFSFKDSTIYANSTRVVIYQGADSIVSPSMQFEFNYAKESLYLTKDNSSLSKAPFTSSYFSMDFNGDELRWNVKTDSLDLSVRGSGREAPLVLESKDFYDADDFQILRNPAFEFNPLTLFVNYAQRMNTQDFSVYELTDAKHEANIVKMAAEFLSQKGMIEYDARLGKVHVQDKAIHFLESAKGKTDYDNLKIHSLADSVSNVTINLKANTMTVRGVDEFTISDLLKVHVTPDKGRVKIFHNRDIKFDGVIDAGNFKITGKKFLFKYSDFEVDLPHINSVYFYVKRANGIREKMVTTMVGVDSTAAAETGMTLSRDKKSGTLFLNLPNNKSGKIKYPAYPRFDSNGGGVVYFNNQATLNGVYGQSIYFVSPSYKLDSLSHEGSEVIAFDGVFVSPGIFPTFKEKLHVMPDMSLGFIHHVPAAGYNMFSPDAKFYGKIQIDMDGLRANGKLDYLGASIASDHFVVYPDSVLAKGKSGELKEMEVNGLKFPQISFNNYQFKWYPKQDKFKIKNLGDPFTMYHKTATMNGNITISKKEITGSGRIITLGSELASRNLKFTSTNFSGGHAKFKLNSSDSKKPAFKGNDVHVEFDLANHFAMIKPEREGDAALEFPYSRIKTSIPFARWDLITKKVSMSKPADVPIEKSYFYSTRKDLDSLRFNAEKAEYDIPTQELKVSGIPYIIVADAKITPENNEVTILANSKISQLKNTKIVLDTAHDYHHLTHGVVDIISRNKYTCTATYQYINNAGDTFAIKMDNFRLEPIEGKKKKQKERVATQQTVANGKVTAEDKIFVAPKIYFKGDMTMYATRPALKLKGYIKLDLQKIPNYNTWINFEQDGTEKDIYLDFDKAITDTGSQVKAGIYFDSDNNLYTSFVTDKKEDKDEDFFLAGGSLYVDKATNEFRIENRKKSSGEELAGKVFNYDETKQEIHFEGPVTFFKGTKSLSLTSSVIGDGNMETKEFKMNAFIAAHVDLPPLVFQLMATNLQATTQLGAINKDGFGDQTELLYKIANLMGEKEVREYEKKSQQAYTPLASISSFASSIVFSNINLKWSQKNKAFYSDGLIGVSNVGRTDINTALEGFMEIKKNEDGTPVFNVLIKADANVWYYIGYTDNRLLVFSSNETVNKALEKKANGNKTFAVGSNEEVLEWVNRFRLTYQGLESSYDLSVPVKEKSIVDSPSTTIIAPKKDTKEDRKKDDGF